MPIREEAPVGAPVWLELLSSDKHRAEDFYGAVFGWTAQHLGEQFGNYVNFFQDDAPIAGMMANESAGEISDTWSTYLNTADARVTLSAAVAAGSKPIVEAVDVMDLGVMGFVSDPTGAAIGLWQPLAHKGFGITGKPGTPVWHELYTNDYAVAVDFYQSVFGWTTSVLSDTEEFRYTVFTNGAVEYAGIFDAADSFPPGVSSHWQVYFGAMDVDATLESITKLGGRVLQPAEDSPYGRLATATDPSGAVFKISSGI
ncbi:MAG: VOC family protein [Mycobacteriaceae bacterium]